MDPEVGRWRAEQPVSDEAPPPPTPLGYSFPVLLQLKQIDLLKEVLRVLPAVFGGKLAPPYPREPRPVTAEQLIREERETQNVLSALDMLGITMN